MAVMPENPAEEIRRLRRCINDLVSVLALPATWTGSAPSQILGNSLDALVSMLSLDFIYARLRESTGKTFTELVRVGSSWESMPRPEEIGKKLQPWLENEPEELPIVVRDLFGKNPTTLVPVHLGLHAEMGVIVAGAQRADFPHQAERLVLNIAANQAAIGLQGLSLLNTQRRLSSELDLQVAQRTAELAAAEERWRSVFENSAIGAALTDLDGRFLAANPVYQEMLGYAERKLQQLSFLDITHEEDIEASRTLVGELLAEKRRQFQIEKQYRRKNGGLIWVRDNVSVVPGTKRVPRFLIALSEDITERKHAEQALLSSALHLRRVSDALPPLAWCNLPDGSNEFLNKRWHAYTGLSPEESHGWGWRVAFHPEDLPPLIKRWQELLISGEPGEIEARLRRHDGVYRWFLIRVEPLRDEEGKIVRWYGTSTDIEGRKQAEDALQASEHKARLLVDSIPGLVVRMTAAGEVEAVNRRLLEYFGRSLEDIRSWATSGVIHPEDLARAIEIVSHSFATGDPYEMEIRVRRFDGVFRWFQARGLPVRDAEGQILHWYALHTDIDDRKRAEEALRDSEQSSRLVLDGIAGLVAIMSATGEVQAVNRQVLEYFGKTVEELKTWSTTDAVHPEDLSSVISAWTGSVETAAPYIVDHRLRGADGVYRWFHARGLPLRDEHGRVVRWYVLLTDIDDRRRAEEALQASERELDLIVNAIPALAWSARPDGSAEFFTQHYRAYVGFPLEQLQGSGWTAAVHPDDLGRLITVWRSMMATGMGGEVEGRLRRFDGAYRWFLFRTNPMLDESGNILKWYGTNADIDDRKRAEEELRNTQTELGRIMGAMTMGQLTASIAHEVNQPLSGIVTNAGTCLRMLDANPPNLEGACEALRRTIRDGNRASEIITRLRTLYSKKEPTLEPMDLNEATREVIALSLGAMQRNRVALRQEFAEDLPLVLGDRIQIQQVILNLVRNGSDAMSAVDDRPREMLIKTECEEGGGVRLSVKDTGVGFDTQSEVKLFHAFYTTKGDGMGIGLSVSRSIIENHRGRLWAVRNEGHGATFLFSIPCSANT